MSIDKKPVRKNGGPGEIASQLDRLSHRQQEIAFGAGLFIIVIAGFFVGEVLSRVHSSIRLTENYNWDLVQSSMNSTRSGSPARFIPGSQVGNMRINSLGFRGPEIPAIKPDDTIRLVFLGDSKILNAEFDEADMLASATVDQLKKLLPECKIDYLTVAGPAYEMSELASIVRSDIKQLQPDIYVLLAGTLGETLDLHALENPSFNYRFEHSKLSDYSRLWDKLSRNFHIARQDRASRRRDELKDKTIDEIAEPINSPIDQLKASVGSTPVIVIAYRGKLRTNQNGDEQKQYTRFLRIETKGLSANDLARLGDHVAIQLKEKSEQYGWNFIDPIADLKPDHANFLDHTHFSRKGVKTLSIDIAESSLPTIMSQNSSCKKGT